MEETFLMDGKDIVLWETCYCVCGGLTWKMRKLQAWDVSSNKHVVSSFHLAVFCYMKWL